MKRWKVKLCISVFWVLLLEALLIFGAVKTCGQVYRLQVAVSYAPEDNGIGIKAGYRFSKYAIYSGFSHGNFSGFDYYNQPFFINDHNRYCLGVTKHLGNSYLSVGVVYHDFGNYELTPHINPRALEKISGEYGAGFSINRFTAGFRFDPFKWTGRIDFGINLFRRKGLL